MAAPHDLAEGPPAGVVAWHSVIHVPPGLHPGAFAEFARALALDGQLLRALEVGDEVRRRVGGHTLLVRERGPCLLPMCLP